MTETGLWTKQSHVCGHTTRPDPYGHPRRTCPGTEDHARTHIPRHTYAHGVIYSHRIPTYTRTLLTLEYHRTRVYTCVHGYRPSDHTDQRRGLETTESSFRQGRLRRSGQTGRVEQRTGARCDRPIKVGFIFAIIIIVGLTTRLGRNSRRFTEMGTPVLRRNGRTRDGNRDDQSIDITLGRGSESTHQTHKAHTRRHTRAHPVHHTDPAPSHLECRRQVGFGSCRGCESVGEGGWLVSAR